MIFSEFRFRSVVLLVLLAPSVPTGANGPLSLQRVEQLALSTPWLQRYQSMVDAAAERSVAASQLPDPQLSLGLVNVPTDSFALGKEDMTMSMVGLRQQIPPGKTLVLRGEQARAMHAAEQARLQQAHRVLTRRVREAWLDVFFAQETLAIVREIRTLQARELKSVEGRYRAAAETQQMVFRTRQELARVDARVSEVGGELARARVELARWTGEPVEGLLPRTLPKLPRPAGFDVNEHPELSASEAGIRAARSEVSMAREEYKPGFMLELSYGQRQDRNDMVTAMVTMDLPVFRNKRQDRRLAERQAQLRAAGYEAKDMKRELEARYRVAVEDMKVLQHHVNLYVTQIIPDLEAEASVTVAGFARDQSMLRSARMRALDAQQELLRMRVMLARKTAELLYLAGEER